LSFVANRQTSGESASLPQYLGCNTVFDMRLRVTFLRRKTVSLLELLSEIFNEGGIKIISLSNIRPIIIYFHSSQCRLIPYLHQRPIFFQNKLIYCRHWYASTRHISSPEDRITSIKQSTYPGWVRFSPSIPRL
jgi:hypothetical protein